MDVLLYAIFAEFYLKDYLRINPESTQPVYVICPNDAPYYEE